MMLGGALERASARPDGPRFVLKGGVALELRLAGRARATEDIDVVAICAEDNMVSALDEAVRVPFDDWTFTRRPETRPLGPLAVRVTIQVAYRSQRWATVQVDLARPDGADAETEVIPAISLAPFGLEGPAALHCLSLRYHIAQKFHGMTKVPEHGTENDRFRDAVDLLLLRDLVGTDGFSAIREACEETFRLRVAHAWPPAITLPERWREPFAALATAVGLEVTALDVAELELRAFIDAIVRSTSITPGPDA